MEEDQQVGTSDRIMMINLLRIYLERDITTQAEHPDFPIVPKQVKKERGEGNNHPTVKPLSLIKYLVTLVTPPDGVCLGPRSWVGGTTAVACIKTNRKYIEMSCWKNTARWQSRIEPYLMQQTIF